jgi:hypothetical protein
LQREDQIKIRHAKTLALADRLVEIQTPQHSDQICEKKKKNMGLVPQAKPNDVSI